MMFASLPLEVYIEILIHVDLEDEDGPGLKSILSLRQTCARLNHVFTSILSRRRGLKFNVTRSIADGLSRMESFKTSKNELWKACFTTIVFDSHVLCPNAPQTEPDLENTIRENALEFFLGATSFINTIGRLLSSIEIVAWTCAEPDNETCSCTQWPFLRTMNMILLYSTSWNENNHLANLKSPTLKTDNLIRVAQLSEWTVGSSKQSTSNFSQYPKTYVNWEKYLTERNGSTKEPMELLQQISDLRVRV